MSFKPGRIVFYSILFVVILYGEVRKNVEGSTCGNDIEKLKGLASGNEKVISHGPYLDENWRQISARYDFSLNPREGDDVEKTESIWEVDESSGIEPRDLLEKIGGLDGNLGKSMSRKENSNKMFKSNRKRSNSYANDSFFKTAVTLDDGVTRVDKKYCFENNVFRNHSNNIRWNINKLCDETELSDKEDIYKSELCRRSFKKSNGNKKCMKLEQCSPPQLDRVFSSTVKKHRHLQRNISNDHYDSPFNIQDELNQIVKNDKVKHKKIKNVTEKPEIQISKELTKPEYSVFNRFDDPIIISTSEFYNQEVDKEKVFDKNSNLFEKPKIFVKEVTKKPLQIQIYTEQMPVINKISFFANVKRKLINWLKPQRDLKACVKHLEVDPMPLYSNDMIKRKSLEKQRLNKCKSKTCKKTSDSKYSKVKTHHQTLHNSTDVELMKHLVKEYLNKVNKLNKKYCSLPQLTSN